MNFNKNLEKFQRKFDGIIRKILRTFRNLLTKFSRNFVFPQLPALVVTSWEAVEGPQLTAAETDAAVDRPYQSQ